MQERLTPERTSRASRRPAVVKTLATTLAALVLFPVLLVSGALLHLGLPVAREGAREVANVLLSDLLRGRIVIGSVDRLDAGGFAVSDFEVFDPSERRVLSVRRVAVGLQVHDILTRLIAPYEKLSVDIEDMRIVAPHVTLLPSADENPDGTPAGHPSLVDAFSLAEDSPDDDAPGRAVRLWFDDLEIRDAEVESAFEQERRFRVSAPVIKAALLVTDKGVALDVPRFALGVTGLTHEDAKLRGEVHVRAPGAVWGDVSGMFGVTPLEQTFRIEGDQVSVKGRVPELRPEAVRPYLPEWPLEVPIAIDNSIEGVLPRLEVDLEVGAGSGTASAKGTIIVSPEFEVELDVDADNLNLAELRKDLPESTINLRSAVAAWTGEKRLAVDLNATLSGSKLDGTDLPTMDFRATLGERGVDARATLHERGLPVSLDFSGPETGPYDFVLHVRPTQIQDSPRLARLTSLRGLVEAEVDGKLSGDDVTLRASAKAQSLSQGDLTVEQLDMNANARAKVSAPKDAIADVMLEAKNARYGAAGFETAKITASGPVLTPHVRLEGHTVRGADLELEGDTRTDRLLVERVTGKVTGRGEPIAVSVARIEGDGSHLVVQDFSFQSAGKCTADLEMAPGRLHVALHALDLDLGRIASEADLGVEAPSGKLDANVNVILAEHSSGVIELTVKDAGYGAIAGVSAKTNVTLDGKRVKGSLEADLAGLGALSSHWDVVLGAPVLDASGYGSATGTFDAKVSKVELSPLALLLGKKLGIQAAYGTLEAKVELERTQGDAFPDGKFEVNLPDLVVDLEQEGTKEIIRQSGVGVDLRSAFQGDRDRVQVALRLFDHRGDIANSSGTVSLPLTEWAAQIPEASEAEEAVLDAPIDLLVLVPRRSLSAFPELLFTPAIDGDVLGRLVVRGSPRDPAFDLAVSAIGLGGRNAALTFPIDAELSARYRPSTGALLGSVRAKQDVHRILSGTFDLTVPIAHLYAPPKADAPLWTGRAQVLFDATPLAIVTPLAERQVGGTLQGSLAVEREGAMPAVHANLRLRHLEVAGRTLGEGTLTAKTSARLLTASARFDDEYGQLEARAEVALTPTSVGATLEPGEPLRFSLDSDRYDAAVLSPFVRSALSELSGALSGRVNVTMIPSASLEGDYQTRFDGRLTLTDATITPAAMGLRLADAHLDIDAAPEGKYNVVHVRNLRAKARSTAYNFKGNADLYFLGFSLERANFNLSQKDLPVMNSGVKIADVSGFLRGQVLFSEKQNRIELASDDLTIRLPESSEQDLIELSDNPTVEVIQPLLEKEKENGGEPSVPLEVAVKLGNSVKVENQMIHVRITGNPRIVVDDEVHIDGGVHIPPGGRVQVMGRVFVLDRGAVVFDTGKSDDPRLDIQATWRAPSGVLVRAMITGTAKNPVLEWSSDPALAGGESAIIALVLGTGSGDSAGSGGAMVLTAAVNEVLSKSGVHGVDFYAARESDSGGQVARLSDRSWDSYTASVQISDEVWFEGSYRVEATGPESDPRSGVSGTIEWRFAPDWSQRTEVGTLGVGLDLMWQYRY